MRLDCHGFRQLLRRRCDALGSQAELAASLDLSAQYLSDVLTGKREPSQSLAQALGYDRHLVFIARPEL